MLLNLLGVSILFALFLLILMIPGGAVLAFIFIVGFCFFLTIFIVVYYSAWAIIWVIETLCVEIWMLSLWVDGYWTRSEAEAKDEHEDVAMADRQREVRRRWARQTERDEWREEGVKKRMSGGAGLRGERGERQMEEQEKEASLGSDGSVSELYA